MSEDWNSVTKIGSKVRTGGGVSDKEKVIRGDSALNAARRSGAAVSTEKKFGGTNSVSLIFIFSLPICCESCHDLLEIDLGEGLKQRLTLPSYSAVAQKASI